MRGARGAGASAGSMPRWEACGSAGGRGLSPTRRPRGAPPPPPTPTAGNRWERPPKRSLWLVAPRLGKAAPPPPSVARGRGAAGGGRPSGVSTQQRLHTGVLAGARRSRRSPVCVCMCQGRHAAQSLCSGKGQVSSSEEGAPGGLRAPPVPCPAACALHFRPTLPALYSEGAPSTDWGSLSPPSPPEHAHPFRFSEDFWASGGRVQ